MGLWHAFILLRVIGQVKIRLKMAEFFFDTFSDMAKNIDNKKLGEDKVATARELREFMANVRKVVDSA